MQSFRCDILIAGAGTGGVAAALAATALGKRVVMTEPTRWVGGQLTAQAVPPDENRMIEFHGCTRRYRAFRDGVRAYYKAHYPLNAEALRSPALNPGEGNVSRLCHEPRVGLAVLESMLAPAVSAELLRVCLGCEPVAVECSGDGARVKRVRFRSTEGGEDIEVSADYVLDATELGDLLPLAQAEYVSGSESRAETREPHAHEGPARPGNMQAPTWCFALSYDPTPGADHTIEKPSGYAQWRAYVPQVNPPWPGPLFSWRYPNVRDVSVVNDDRLDPRPGSEAGQWVFRRILHSGHFAPGKAPRSVTLVNWVQIDYMKAGFIDVPADAYARRMADMREQSLSFLYWMQTEAPRLDGGTGWAGLYLRPDVTGTPDGLAMAPYHRESRRIRAVFTVTENHVGTQARGGWDLSRDGQPPKGREDLLNARAERFEDSVGIGHYRIDLHPTCEGDHYLDISALPFQIPLGALIPVRMKNLLPAAKNIGVTHITNGCYRLHPVEWNVGESAGALAAFCLERKVEPQAVRDTPALLAEFQKVLTGQGIPLEWPSLLPS